MRHIILVAVAALVLTAVAAAEDPVFSGPQVGEKLTPFEARAVFGNEQDKDFDVVKKADGKPVAIVFVHELTRPSVGLLRMVTGYAKKHEKAGLHTGVVFLTDDPTAMEARLKRARHALPNDVPVGIFREGEEGPGPYGLNRKVTLTILVGKENKVTGNFALVQPSDTDAVKIGHAIAKVMDIDKKPTLADMGGDRRAMMRGNDDGRFRALMAPVIRKGATEEQVKMAAKKVEDFAAKNMAFRARVATVANRIIDAGRLGNYGTPTAREYLKKWAKDFAAKQEDKEETSDASKTDEGNKEEEEKEADESEKSDD